MFLQKPKLLSPLSVVAALLVSALISMSAEEVALSGHQVGGQTIATVCVQIVEGATHSWAWNATSHAKRNDAPPGSLKRN